jgi:hypothetical protein
MRYLISVLLLITLIVGWQRPAAAQADVTDTIGSQGGDFVLGWPAGRQKKACIKIKDADIGPRGNQVDPGTKITISLVTESHERDKDWPKPFVDYDGQPSQNRVFPPIIGFSADPPINLAGTPLTIAMCVQYPGNAPVGLQLAHPVERGGNTVLDPWPAVTVPADCNLRCYQPPEAGVTIDFLGRLFAASPFSVTPLYAVPLAEGGLGGGGGSLSPFAAVVVEP